MFSTTSPIATPNTQSIAGFPISLPPNNYAPSALISNLAPVDTFIPTTPPPIVGGIVTIPSPLGVKPQTLVINGQTYYYTLVSPPPAGEFTDVTGQLQIGYLGLVPPLAISYYLAPIAIQTDTLLAPYPEICTRFPLSGELSWTLMWEEQPTASFKFITLANQRSAIIDYFRSATQIEIYGVGFCPSGQLSINEISLTKSAIPLIEVSVNLTGWHAHFLDQYVSIGNQLYLTDCTTPPISEVNSPSAMTVQDLAQLVGTNLVGGNILIDPNILSSPAVPTTLGSQLDTAAVRGLGAFLDFNQGSGIAIKQYAAVGSHQITTEQIRSDINSSINNKIGLTSSYYKTYDPLTKISYGGRPATPNTAAPAPTWQPRRPETTTTTDGDPDPSISPYSGNQADLSIIFDISGKRKRRKDITLVNGQPIQEYSQEWGYVAVGFDDIVFSSGVSPTINRIDGSWRPIEITNTSYTYNGNGYLISVASSGYKRTRYKSENAQKPESLSIRRDSNNNVTDPLEIAKLETYRFFNLPISRRETYTLELLSDYYDDIRVPSVNRSICLPDGSSATIPVADEAYIPQYFVAEKSVSEDGFSSIANPQSTALKPLPDLTTGKTTKFIERVKIEHRPTLSRSITEVTINPSYYTKSTDNYSATDGQFGNMLSIAQSEIISGRPPIAPNTGARLELVTPPQSPTPPPPPAPFAVRSGLSSESTGYVTIGSLDFPTATTQSQALLAARVDIDLINAKNTHQESLLIDFRPQIRPGDLASYRVDGETRERRVISASFTLKINGIDTSDRPIITTTGTALKLGLNAQTPVVLVNLPRRTSTLRI